MNTVQIALVGATLLIAACATPNETLRTVDFDPTAFSRLDLRLDAGDVTLVPGEDAAVEATLRWRGDLAPELESRLAGGTLLVSLSCPQGSKDCGGDVQVTVPITTEVDLANGQGAIDIVDFTGPLDLAVEAGSVTATNTNGGLRVDVGSGTIALADITGRFDVQTTTGDIVGTGLGSPIGEAVSDRGSVDLSFATAPDLADLTTGAGDITVSVPAGEYDVDATSRRGDVTVEGLTNTSNAPSVILARSTGGNIAVRGR